jgi:replication-associated recombination protein RarA
MAEIFEQAARTKLRFETSKGLLSVEEVWDLSLASLDMLAQATSKRLREEQERLEILKHVIVTKVVKRDIARKKADDRAKLARLKELLAAKEDEGFKALSQEEILKQIGELEAAV